MKGLERKYNMKRITSVFLILIIALATLFSHTHPFEVSANENDWIDISTPEELASIRENLDRNYRLIDDIDLVNWGEWIPIGEAGIGSEGFTGEFDGQYHIISNMTIDNPPAFNPAGLFGGIEETSTIKNVGLENININNGNQNTGGLVGRNEGGIISQSYTTGNINGVGSHSNNYGGLVGYSANGIIENSYSTVDIDAEGFGSGIVNQHTGTNTLKNVYSIGKITDSDNGGINRSRHVDSTSINAYWDIETSEQERSMDGEGKTTEEMYQQSTYENWDFDEIWIINEGNDYPKLRGFMQEDPIPSQPSLEISNTEETSITLSWDDVQYAVEYLLSRDGEVIYSGSDLEFEDTNLNPDRSYEYTLIAINDSGTSDEEVMSGKTDLPIPNTPTLSVDDVTETSIILTWDSVNYADEYTLERDGEVVYSGSSTSYEDTELIDNTEYTYTLIAMNKSGESGESTVTETTDIALPENLELTVPDIQSLPDVTLQGQAQTYNTSFDNHFSVIGTDEGWRLDVSATPFGNGEHQLPTGSLVLAPVNEIERTDEIEGDLPSNTFTSSTVIDDQVVTVLSADAGEGVGEFDVTFPNDALSLTIDPTTALVGDYETTITWSLVTAP